MKAGFPNNYGGYGPVDVIALYNKQGTETKEVVKSPDQIVDELKNWY